MWSFEFLVLISVSFRLGKMVIFLFALKMWKIIKHVVYIVRVHHFINIYITRAIFHRDIPIWTIVNSNSISSIVLNIIPIMTKIRNILRGLDSYCTFLYVILNSHAVKNRSYLCRLTSLTILCFFSSTSCITTLNLDICLWPLTNQTLLLS